MFTKACMGRESGDAKNALKQSALPIVHGINGVNQRGGWDNCDLENDWDSTMCMCRDLFGIYSYSVGSQWPHFDKGTNW